MHVNAQGRNSFKGTLHLHAQGMYMEMQRREGMSIETNPSGAPDSAETCPIDRIVGAREILGVGVCGVGTIVGGFLSY